MLWKIAVSNVKYMQIIVNGLKHAQTSVWSFSCCVMIQHELKRHEERKVSSDIWYQTNRTRSVGSCFVSAAGFDIATCRASTARLPSVRWDCVFNLQSDSAAPVARVLYIWIFLVYHIIISSAGYKGSTIELQQTNKETKKIITN